MSPIPTKAGRAGTLGILGRAGKLGMLGNVEKLGNPPTKPGMLKLKLKLGIWKVIIVQFMPPGMKPMDGTLKPGTWKPGMTICGN